MQDHFLTFLGNNCNPNVSSESFLRALNAKKNENQHEEHFTKLETSVCNQKVTHQNLSEHASSNRFLLISCTDTIDKEPVTLGEDFGKQVLIVATNNLLTGVQNNGSVDSVDKNDMAAKLNNANLTLKQTCSSDQNSEATVQKTHIPNFPSPATERCTSMQEVGSNNHGSPGSTLPCNRWGTTVGCVTVAERNPQYENCEEVLTSKAPEKASSTRWDIAAILFSGYGVIIQPLRSETSAADDDAAADEDAANVDFQSHCNFTMGRQLALMHYSRQENNSKPLYPHQEDSLQITHQSNCLELYLSQADSMEFYPCPDKIIELFPHPSDGNSELVMTMCQFSPKELIGSQEVSHSRLTETKLSFASFLCQVRSCSVMLASQQQAFRIEVALLAIKIFNSAMYNEICSQDVEKLRFADFHETLASQQHGFRLELALLAIKIFNSAMHSRHNVHEVFYETPAQQPLVLYISTQKEVLCDATAPCAPFVGPNRPTNYSFQVITLFKACELSHPNTMASDPLSANPFARTCSACTSIHLRQTSSDPHLFQLMGNMGSSKQVSLSDEGCSLASLPSGSTQMLALMHHKVHPTSQDDHKAYPKSQDIMFSRVGEPPATVPKQRPKQTDTVCANYHLQRSLVYPASQEPAIQHSSGIVSQGTASIHHNPFQKISQVFLHNSVHRMSEGRLVHFTSCSSKGATHLETVDQSTKLGYFPLNTGISGIVEETSCQNTSQKGGNVTVQNIVNST